MKAGDSCYVAKENLKKSCLDWETCCSLKTFIDSFSTSEITRHFRLTEGMMTSKRWHCIFVSETTNHVIRYSPRKKLLNRLSIDLDVHFICHCSLQNFGNQLVTGDIRFTEGTMTSKGGSTFLSARLRISLYVTHHQRNSWTAYRQTRILPWLSSSLTERRKLAG